MKVSQKQDLAKKILARLTKEFGKPPAPVDRTVLETLLFGVCLENESIASAERAYQKLREDFHDLNEIRVSSISELMVSFSNQQDAELRAHRVRTILQYVFEDQFEFNLEELRKKNQDQVARKFEEIRDLSPFVRHYAQQCALGAHLMPLDDRQSAAAIWLGLVEANTEPQVASERLKPAIRKADGPSFCFQLRRLVTEAPGAHEFDPDSFAAPEGEVTASEALSRLEEALDPKKPSKPKPKAATKPAAKKKPEKAASTAKAAAAKTKKATKTASKSKAHASVASSTKQEAAETASAKKKPAKKSAPAKASPAKKAAPKSDAKATAQTGAAAKTKATKKTKTSTKTAAKAQTQKPKKRRSQTTS